MSCFSSIQFGLIPSAHDALWLPHRRMFMHGARRCKSSSYSRLVYVLCAVLHVFSVIKQIHWTRFNLFEMHVAVACRQSKALEANRANSYFVSIISDELYIALFPSTCCSPLKMLFLLHSFRRESDFVGVSRKRRMKRGLKEHATAIDFFALTQSVD